MIRGLEGIGKVVAVGSVTAFGSASADLSLCHLSQPQCPLSKVI